MKKALSLVLAGVLLLLSLAGCAQKEKLNPDDPVTLTMWHVYGGQTESPLNDSIDEFNRTVGKEKGIVINVVSVSSSSAIDEALTAAATNTPGAPTLPDLFTAYPRVAQIIGYDRLGIKSLTPTERTVFDYYLEGNPSLRMEFSLCKHTTIEMM